MPRQRTRLNHRAYTHALQDTLWTTTKAQQGIPPLSWLPMAERRACYLRGGVENLLRDFLITRCPMADRPWLKRVLHQRIPARDRVKPHGYYDTSLRRELNSYLREYTKRRGRYAITTALRRDRREDLIHQIRKRGGLVSLLTKWGIAVSPELQRRDRCREILRQLRPHYRKDIVQGVLPRAKLVQRQHNGLYLRIQRWGPNFTGFAKTVGMETQESRQLAEIRRHHFALICERWILTGHLPRLSEMPDRSRRYLRRKQGVHGFIHATLQDKALRADVRTFAERLRTTARTTSNQQHRARLVTLNNVITIALNGGG